MDFRPDRQKLASGVAAFVIAIMAPVAASARDTAKPLSTAETSAGNFLAALAADARRDPAGASHYFREALRADPRNTELLERAFVASVQDGNVDQSFRLAERVLQRDAQNGLANLVLGVRAMKNRQFQTARNSFQKAGGRGRNADISSALLVAWTYVGSGDLKRALETVDRFTEPQLAVYRNFYGGLMADVAGDRKEAAKRLKAAHEADPNVVRVADAYARFEIRHGSKEAAKEIYEKLSQRPASLAFIAPQKKMLDENAVPDPLVMNAVQGAAEVLYTSSDTGGRRGGEQISLIYLQLASHLHGDHDMTAMALGETFEQLKQHERSIDIYLRTPETSGLRNRAVIRAAYAWNEMKKPDQAVRVLEERIAKVPFEVTLHETLASIYRGEKKWKEAAEASSKAISLVDKSDKRYWSLFYGRGIAYERGKEWPLAEADLKHALSLLPEDPKTEEDKYGRAHVLNHLAYSWVDMGMHIEESFIKLKQAVDLQPRDGYIIDSLGWAYYKLGKFEDAVRELEKAVDIKPQDPVLNDHLGDAYWKVGRVNEARFQWNHARDMKPEPDDLEKILKKIERGLEEPQAAGDKKPNGG
jgi:tetratricopeptide (TPR) repeat protein